MQVGRYHARLSAGERRTAHNAFLCDDIEVMVRLGSEDGR
jgi:superfamily II DNA helicase RecQ